jgi:hypothetical protein
LWRQQVRVTIASAVTSQSDFAVEKGWSRLIFYESLALCAIGDATRNSANGAATRTANLSRCCALI